jgi:hypothetical protein
VPIDRDLESARGGVTARVYNTVLDRYLLLILGIRIIFM